MIQDATSIPTGKRAEKPAHKAKSARKARTRQVRKCVEAVHITNNITLVQRKLINGLLLNAYYELPNQSITIHRIQVSQLVDLIGYDSNDIARIKVLLKALTNTVIEWDIMNEAGKREWGVSALLASADIIDGVCTYAYSPHLRAKLFNPQFYVLLDMDIVRRFQSGYALALYENCARYRRLGQTPSFPIEVVRSLLGARDPYYDDYRKLNERVLQPALREVNAVTDLALSIEVKREVRQVAEIRFLIGNNPQQCMQIGPPRDSSEGFEAAHPSTSSSPDTVTECDKSAAIASNTGSLNEDVPEANTPALEGNGSLAGPNPLLVRLQHEFCLSSRVAARVCSENPEAAIQGAMDYVLSRYNAGKVKDIDAKSSGPLTRHDWSSGWPVLASRIWRKSCVASPPGGQNVLSTGRNASAEKNERFVIATVYRISDPTRSWLTRSISGMKVAGGTALGTSLNPRTKR